MTNHDQGDLHRMGVLELADLWQQNRRRPFSRKALLALLGLLVIATAVLPGCAGPQTAQEASRRQALAQAFSAYARQQSAAQAPAPVTAQPQRVIICNLPADSSRHSC